MQRSLILATLALLPLAACQEQSGTPVAPALAPQFSAAALTESLKVPIDIGVFVDCAADGAGEFVLLSGELHILNHTTVDANGGLHVKSHFQPQGITGVGDVTGDKYQGTGVTQEEFNLKIGETDSFVNNYRMIGQGPGNNFLVHENVHVTYNANGTLTADVDNFRAECK